MCWRINWPVCNRKQDLTRFVIIPCCFSAWYVESHAEPTPPVYNKNYAYLMLIVKHGICCRDQHKVTSQMDYSCNLCGVLQGLKKRGPAAHWKGTKHCDSQLSKFRGSPGTKQFCVALWKVNSESKIPGSTVGEGTGCAQSAVCDFCDSGLIL